MAHSADSLPVFFTNQSNYGLHVELPMKSVQPLNKEFNVALHLPGSKSITLRDAVLAALANGPSELRYPGDGDDIRRMEDALQKLGIMIADDGKGHMRVEGRNGHFRTGPVELNVGLSATSTRFLIALSALRRDTTFLDGHPSMRVRPNKYLLDAIAALGATVTSTKDGYLPVSIVGAASYAKAISMKGDVSSQYFSALLQIAPLLPHGLEINVQGELVSKPYIDITINEMKKFGVHVENHTYQKFFVAHQNYQPTTLTVEGDASAASYFSALATIHGGTVTVENLGHTTSQGDFQFYEICKKLGAHVTASNLKTTIRGPYGGKLCPLDEEIDMKSMPDVALTLIAIAPLIPGVTKITGLGTLRVKECDRIAAPARELKKLGVQVIEGNDYIEIHELLPRSLREDINIETYHDHRMAMSFAVLGTKLGKLTILDPHCVDKTYPLFWEDLDKFY